MAGKYWREAATLLLVSKSSISNNYVSKSSFNLLMLKRSSKSKFMPNACVFPGGVLDSSDMSTKWKDHLLKFNDSLPKWNGKEPSPMTYQVKSSNETLLPREVAFRINAIRETFEETGILLSTNLAAEQDLDPEWRHRVHENPSEFLTLCQHLNTAPDIWSLHEWSDWLTPTQLKTEKSRFDTIFYITFRETISTKASEDNKEVSQVQQFQPNQALNLHTEEKIWLPPPQFYELSRLATFMSFENLKAFSEERAKNYGVDVWFPQFFKCSDGMASIYPGDDQYPIHPDYEGLTEGQNEVFTKKMSLEEFSKKSENRNRMERRSMYDNVINCNIEDPCGHRFPI